LEIDQERPKWIFLNCNHPNLDANCSPELWTNLEVAEAAVVAVIAFPAPLTGISVSLF